MIMRQGQLLLLPANPLLHLGQSDRWPSRSTCCSTLAVWGRAAWAPDLLALALVFWGVHQPQRMGMGVCFCLRSADGRAPGQRCSVSMLWPMRCLVSLRLSPSTVGCSGSAVSTQAMQILPLLAAAHAVVLAVRMMVGGHFPGWSMLLAPFLEAALWPLATLLLLLPQRRAPDPDANRPL